MRAQSVVRREPRSSRLLGLVYIAGLVGLLLPGCSADRFGEPDSPEYRTGPCESGAECRSGRRCLDGGCVIDYGDCRGDDDCQNDTYCACPPDIRSERCACVPWGQPPRPRYDDKCQGGVFLPSEFLPPQLKCEWPERGTTPPAYKDVLTTPLVIDLEGDGSPEIVFAAGTVGPTHLIALSGRDCSVKWDKQTKLSGCTSIAAADLDGDGKVEIVGLAPGLTIFSHLGDVLASRLEPGSGPCFRDYPPAIANLDGMGPPEIVAGAAVLRYVSTPTPKIDLLWNNNIIEEGTWGTIAVPVDLDGDGVMEVVSGHNVFDGLTGANKTRALTKDLIGGYPAIGDFNRDGHPDIVLVSSRNGDQKVSILDYFNNRFLMPPTAAKDGWGGPPTVADFDGDGQPEFATASRTFYYVYSPDCLQSPLPKKCQGQEDGVLWQSATEDESSGSTGSSVFDFNGDGVAEVVYRDECWLRVYNGPDGSKRFAAPVTSGTVQEEPVIADVDGDGHAEIVVGSDSAQNNRCKGSRSSVELGIKHPGASFGLRVYKDPQDRWMPSRRIWNQHAYHITNVNDDGSVPVKQADNWRSYNNFRMNVQGQGQSIPPRGDGTGKIGLPPDVGDCTTLFRLSGQLCNRGVAPLLPGLPSTFYLGDPRRPGAQVLCVATTDQPVFAGECASITCDWKNPAPPPYDLWLRIDDDGAGRRPVPQCKAGNDLAHLPLTGCPNQPG